VFKKIISGYKNLFFFTTKVVILVVFCVGFGFMIVWPLWKFATTAPRIYTWCVLTCMVFFLLRYLYIKARALSLITILLSVIQILIAVGGCVASVFFILSGNRLGAVPVIAVGFVLIGLFRFGFHDK
jgi:hypothetical protein